MDYQKSYVNYEGDRVVSFLSVVSEISPRGHGEHRSFQVKFPVPSLS
jgi:hypothetical protein